MTNSVFNPFGKPLAEVSADDLSRLRDVNEGWCIEYKRELPSARDVSKSIAAFANHAGGWLFVGVRSSSDMLSAEACDGLLANDLVATETQLRDAVIGHLSPAPLFECRAVTGPSSDGFLGDGHAVLIVHVHRGHNAPYVHSSGRIYRRVADSSDPKPETDRAVIDLLFERGRHAVRHLEAMLADTPVVSKAEKATCYAHVWMLSDPAGDARPRSRLTFDEFARTVNDPDHWYGMRFENAYVGADEFVARMVAGNDPCNRLATLHHYLDGSTRLTLPINSGEIPDGCERIMRAYSHYERFKDLLRRSRFTRGQVLDVNLLFILVADLWRKHILLSRLGRTPQRVHAKMKLENAWRRIPFFDTGPTMEFMDKHGVPVIQEESVIMPRQNDLLPGTFIELDAPNATDDLFERSILAGVAMFVGIIEGVGIPRGTLEKSLEEMDDVCRRAVEHSKEIARLATHLRVGK